MFVYTLTFFFLKANDLLYKTLKHNKYYKRKGRIQIRLQGQYSIEK
jgi:hypothetical protein